jgi:23S rRNA (adenine2503-C2)-methyltransferase
MTNNEMQNDTDRMHASGGTNLFGFTEEALEQALGELGLEPYRARQVFYWLYNRRATDFREMLNLPKTLRTLLENRFSIAHPAIRDESDSGDSTRKFLVALYDGLNIEAVLIPSESDDPDQRRRLTLCVSTQVGCPLNCRFCATASMKLKRNLTTGEIVGQYVAAQKSTSERITNLVFMGMGEPFLNYEAVMESVRILTHEKTGGVSAHHITISTAGLVEGIRRFADEGSNAKLAISLHATTDALRAELMPINARHPIQAILEAAEYYYRRTRKRITYEYILFEGLNDGDGDVARLVKLTRRVPSKLNLIPFHPIDAAYPEGAPLDLRPTPRASIDAFAAKLRERNVTVMLRSSSGRDINAACGQLAIQHSPAGAIRTATHP